MITDSLEKHVVMKLLLVEKTICTYLSLCVETAVKDSSRVVSILGQAVYKHTHMELYPPYEESPAWPRAFVSDQ